MINHLVHRKQEQDGQRRNEKAAERQFVSQEDDNAGNRKEHCDALAKNIHISFKGSHHQRLFLGKVIQITDHKPHQVNNSQQRNHQEGTPAFTPGKKIFLMSKPQN